MIESDRLISASADGNEERFDKAIRPLSLKDYVGQQVVREQMEIFISAARMRGEPLDHTLVFGPPGLGKTTLANIISNEMGVDLKTTSGPVLERAGDLAAIMTNLEAGDVLFIDEIHRLSPVVEEVLYPAMEDYQLDIMIGEGPAARSIKLDLPPFTLVGATTRAGLLTSPLRDRFGIVQRLEFYSVAELASIVTRSAGILAMEIDEKGAAEIARRARPAHSQPAAAPGPGLRRCENRWPGHRPGGGRCPEHAECGRVRVRSHGQAAVAGHHREIRWRSRRCRQPLRRHRRGAGHHRGCGGTLPGRVT